MIWERLRACVDKLITSISNCPLSNTYAERSSYLTEVLLLLEKIHIFFFFFLSSEAEATKIHDCLHLAMRCMKWFLQILDFYYLFVVAIFYPTISKEIHFCQTSVFQIQSTEQYFAVVLFMMLHKVVPLLFSLWLQS